MYSSIDYTYNEPGVRILIPLFAVGVYSVSALWWNRRTATITPGGVRVTIGPIPMTTARKAKKDKILHCYVHTVVVRDLDDGSPLETYDNVGIETIDGEPITVSGPHMAPGEAIQAAKQVAQVLAPIEVHVVDYQPGSSRRARRILWNAAFWLALTLFALFVGFAWELEWWLSPSDQSASRETMFSAEARAQVSFT